MHLRFLFLLAFGLLIHGCSQEGNNPEVSSKDASSFDAHTPLDAGPPPTDGTVVEDIQPDETEPSKPDSKTPPSDPGPPPPDPGPPPPPPPEPTAIAESTEPQPEMHVNVLAEGEYVIALPLKDDWIVAQGTKGVVYLDGSGVEPLVISEAEMSLSAAVAYGDIRLVLGSDALYVLQENALSVSPLTEELGETSITSMIAQGDDLWLATQQSLHLYRDGFLHDVTLTNVALGGGLLAFGAPIDGTPALWVATGSQVVGLVEADGVVTGWVERDDLQAAAMAADADKLLWVLSDGDLYKRSPDGHWDWLRLPNPAIGLAAVPTAKTTWVTTEIGVWIHANGHFWQHDDAIELEQIAADSQGRLVAISSGSIHRFFLGEIPEPEPITWAGDVEPIAEKYCASCHGDGKFAHSMYTYDHWVLELDKIVANVKSGAMPLGAAEDELLSAAEIQTIEGWAAGGFLE